MRIIAVDTIDDMGRAAAELVVKKVLENPSCTLGLATGSTPISLYKHLIQAYRKSHISFKNVKTVNLDEYVGLDGNNKNSYRHFMNEHLFEHLDILRENTYVPSGILNAETSIEVYKKLLEAQSIDLQILGIGTNGHIGFNEPGVSFDSRVHKVKLDEQTIKDNSRYFENADEVPKYAITMGIADIMDAKEIILMAGAESKKDAIRKVLEGPVTNDCPATILRKHKGLTIIALKNVLHDINLNLL